MNFSFSTNKKLAVETPKALEAHSLIDLLRLYLVFDAVNCVNDSIKISFMRFSWIRIVWKLILCKAFETRRPKAIPKYSSSNPKCESAILLT